MACLEHGIAFDLAARQTRSLPDIRGAALLVARGRLWITQHNDIRDFVLSAGDCWVADRDGLTVVEAQEDATIVLPDGTARIWAGGAATAARAGGWAERLRGFATAFFTTPSRNAIRYY